MLVKSSLPTDLGHWGPRGQCLAEFSDSGVGMQKPALVQLSLAGSSGAKV